MLWYTPFEMIESTTLKEIIPNLTHDPESNALAVRPISGIPNPKGFELQETLRPHFVITPNQSATINVIIL